MLTPETKDIRLTLPHLFPTMNSKVTKRTDPTGFRTRVLVPTREAWG